MFAAEIRGKRAYRMRDFSNWRWHVDEVSVKIKGERRYLWRAALKLPRKLMKRDGRPEEVVTDRLPSYRAALRELGAQDRQASGRWLNNRIENSYQPFRRRERAMLRFRRMRSLQPFAAVHSSIHIYFNIERHLHRRSDINQYRAAAFEEWRRLGAA